MCAALKGVYLYMNPDFLRNWPKKKKIKFSTTFILLCSSGNPVSVSEDWITGVNPQAQRHNCLFTK